MCSRRSKANQSQFFGYFLFVFLVVAAFWAGPMYAQATGGLTGTVQDETRAVVPGADVQTRNTGTGLTLQGSTNAAGNFRFPEVPIGHYDVTVSVSGFRQMVRRGIEVLTGRTVDLRLTLQVGEVTESIEVVGATPMVETTDAEVKSTIDSRSMVDLPLNGRNPLQLVVLTPGARFTSVSSRTTPEQGGFGNNPGITVNGLAATDNNYRVDGGSYNNPQNNVPPTLPNPDALQEFTVKSSNYSAEYTRGGAVVLLSTKSGGNEFHGTLFEFLRNDDLDATNFFNDSKPLFIRNQYGGTLGGPIVRDKAFFFVSYEGTRRRGSPSEKTLTLATPQERQGDFSARGRVIVDPLSGEPFPNNQVPANRISSVTDGLLEITPLPAPGGNRLTVPKEVNQDDDQVLARGDLHFSSNNQFSVRYFYDQLDAQRDTSSIPGVFGSVTFENQLVGINDTHTFSPNLLVTGSFNWTYTTTLLAPTAPVTLQSLGVQAPLATEQSVPELRIPTLSGLTRYFSGGLLDFDPQLYEWRGHVSWNKGKHLIRFGVDAEHVIEDAKDVSNGSGQFRFRGDRTGSSAVSNSGDAFADFLLGLPDTFDQRATSPQEMEENKIQPWIQDTWKAHPRLTLNFGLRWEPWLAPTDNLFPLAGLVPGAVSTVAPDAPAGLVFAGAGVSDLSDRDKIFKNDYNNFAPRFGFAVDLLGDGKSVIRGGYGVFYRSFPLNIIRDTAQRVAFRGLEVNVFEPFSFEDPFAGVSGGSPFQTPFVPPALSELQNFQFLKPLSTGTLDPTNDTSYTQSWNLTIEREIMPDMSFSIGYVGNNSVKMVRGREGNPALFGPGATRANVNTRRLLPGLSVVRFRTDDYETANFHSLQVEVVHRSRTGLNLLANYVFGKAIDINSGGGLGGTGLRNPFNPRQDRGRADIDVTHRAVVSVLYPIPRLVDGSAGILLNNWQVNSIITAQTGLPFEIRAGRDRSLAGINLDNADLVGSEIPEFDSANLDRTFNTAAFTQPPLGTFGNAGRNILAGPGEFLVDFSVFKDFPIDEARRVQFRFEAFNFFNHTNFDNPNSTLTNRNFGRILSAKDPRVLQFGLKFIF